MLTIGMHKENRRLLNIHIDADWAEIRHEIYCRQNMFNNVNFINHEELKCRILSYFYSTDIA